MEAVKVRQYPLHYHGDWSIDFDGLEHAITDRTRAIVLVNPNNPTGSFVRRGEVERLATYNLPLISDEVFADYTFRPDPDRVSTLVDIPNVTAFCMSGLSKVAGLPQMKLGWIITGGPQQEEIFALLEFIADTYLSVSSPVQLAASELLEAGAEVQRQIQARVRGNLATLKQAIAPDSPCTLLNVQGGWYATLQVPRNRTEEEWVLTLLENEGVLVQPGYFYDFEAEAYLILSLLTAPATFHAGVQRLLRRIVSGE
jgi:alanine-synthesizing transaminase